MDKDVIKMVNYTSDECLGDHNCPPGVVCMHGNCVVDNMLSDILLDILKENTLLEMAHLFASFAVSLDINCDKIYERLVLPSRYVHETIYYYNDAVLIKNLTECYRRLQPVLGEDLGPIYHQIMKTFFNDFE